MKQKSSTSQGLPRRRRRFGRAQGNEVVDPYKLRQKLPNGSRCPSCGVIYERGRWQWPHDGSPAPAQDEHCTACRRIQDKYPAGTITLEGPLVAAKRAELLGLVRNVEKAEKAEHCQNRIMAIEEPSEDKLVITTTDIHLPRRLGEALERAFRGDLHIHFDEENYSVRVDWRRDDRRNRA